MFNFELSKLFRTKAWEPKSKQYTRLSQTAIKTLYPAARERCGALFTKIVTARSVRNDVQRYVEKKIGMTWADVAAGKKQEVVLPAVDPNPAHIAKIADLEAEILALKAEKKSLNQKLTSVNLSVTTMKAAISESADKLGKAKTMVGQLDNAVTVLLVGMSEREETPGGGFRFVLEGITHACLTDDAIMKNEVFKPKIAGFNWVMKQYTKKMVASGFGRVVSID